MSGEVLAADSITGDMDGVMLNPRGLASDALPGPIARMRITRLAPPPDGCIALKTGHAKDFGSTVINDGESAAHWSEKMQQS